jgi:hypothetical protein
MGLNEKRQKAFDCYMSMSMRQWPEALHAWIAATSVYNPIGSGDGIAQAVADWIVWRDENYLRPARPVESEEE